MVNSVDRSRQVGLVAATSATPDYSTSTNPPSIQFNAHPHTLTISGKALDELAAKPGATMSFVCGGSHSHTMKLTSEQAQILVRDGTLRAEASGGHNHVVTFKRQGDGAFLAVMEPTTRTPARR